MALVVARWTGAAGSRVWRADPVVVQRVHADPSSAIQEPAISSCSPLVLLALDRLLVHGQVRDAARPGRMGT